MIPSDEELLSGIAEGDREAFSALYDRYAPRLFGLLLRIVADRTMAEDALQAAFWQVWLKAARFDVRRGKVDIWLQLIARSRAKDLLRAKERAPRLSEVGETAEGVCPIDPIDRGECADKVRKALSQLQVDQAAAIRAAFFDGLTYEQIATRSGLPLGTVKSRIHRGMDVLRRLLETYREDRP